MNYRVVLHRRVGRALKRLPANDAQRIGQALSALIEEPRPSGAKKLAGVATWRLRVGEYRILYVIFDRQQLITVEHVERRTTHTYD